MTTSNILAVPARDSHPPAAVSAPLPRLDAPTVSIVVCNFNYARYLEEAVASACAQQPPCEVIVVDDGSTDGSRDLLRRWQAPASAVQVVLQPNAGQAAAYNAGFACSSGDVVIFLDADDALDAQAAQSVRSRFGVGVAKVHFRMTLVDEHGRALGGSLPSTLATGDVRRGLIDAGILYPSPPGSGNAYRRSVLERLFPLPVDAADRVGADFFAIYGSVAFGTVAACERPLARYRLHRRREAAGDELVFGNAALGNDEAAKVVSRYARLRSLVAERTAGAVTYAPRLLDFSVQKSSFAAAVLGRSGPRALLASGDVLLPLLKSIWLQPAFRRTKRFGLTAWAVLLLVAPRPMAFRLARYVCNPASRAP